MCQSERDPWASILVQILPCLCVAVHVVLFCFLSIYFWCSPNRRKCQEIGRKRNWERMNQKDKFHELPHNKEGNDRHPVYVWCKTTVPASLSCSLPVLSSMLTQSITNKCDFQKNRSSSKWIYLQILLSFSD